jgi:hypothetical protein
MQTGLIAFNENTNESEYTTTFPIDLPLNKSVDSSFPPTLTVTLTHSDLLGFSSHVSTFGTTAADAHILFASQHLEQDKVAEAVCFFFL